LIISLCFMYIGFKVWVVDPKFLPSSISKALHPKIIYSLIIWHGL
jgi:hypothetical protein